MVDVSVSGGVPVSREVDTGAAVSVMSQKQQRELSPDAQLQPVNIALHAHLHLSASGGD